MGGYIRIDKEQAQDARLLDLADELAEIWRVFVVRAEQPGTFQSGEDLSDIENRHALRNALLGALVTLWIYADTHIRADNSLPVTLSGLAPLVGLPVTVLEVFPDNWIKVRGDGYVELPGYCEKNGIRAKDLRRADTAEKRDHEREQARARQQRRREKLKLSSHAVTSRKNGRDNHAVTPYTGTGTGTLDPTGTVPSEKERKTPAHHAPLASAQGRLTARMNATAENRRGGQEVSRPTKTQSELESAARLLAQAGNQSGDIARMLAQYGVTLQQVTQWLANMPPLLTAAEGAS